ncbi:MAG: cytochrome P450, partial [Candidatus Eremiobacterota bacterium]
CLAWCLGMRPELRERMEEPELLEATVSETLRLYPPLWAVERNVAEEDEVGGYRLPVGSTVVMSPYVVHRDPRFWSQPERFHPERWLEPGERPRFAYLPFGGGSRQCIGMQLALLEARLIAGAVASRFRLDPLHPLTVKAGVTLSPGRLLVRLARPGDPRRPSPPSVARDRKRDWLHWSRELRSDLARGSLRLDGVEYAHLGEGPPVLALHGTPGGYDQGLRTLGHLGDAGFTLVVPSRPGYLRTRLELARTFPEQADLMVRLLDGLKLSRVAVAGFGSGGTVGLWMAHRHPERVSRLVLLASPTERLELTAANARLRDLLTSSPGAWFSNLLAHQSPQLAARTLIDAKGYLDPHEAEALLQTTLRDPEKVEFLLGTLESVAPVYLRKHGLRNDLDQLGAPEPLPLERIPHPVLLVHGTRDADVPVGQAERAAERLPNARLELVEDAIHYLHLSPAWKGLVAAQAAFLAGD